MQYLKQQQPASIQRKGVVQPATLYFPATFTTKEMGTSDCILVKLLGLAATARWRQGAGWLGRIVTKKGKTSLNADHVCHHHVHHLSSLHQQGDSVTLSLYSVVSHLICIKVATFTRSKDNKTLGFVCLNFDRMTKNRTAQIWSTYDKSLFDCESDCEKKHCP